MLPACLSPCSVSGGCFGSSPTPCGSDYCKETRTAYSCPKRETLLPLLCKAAINGQKWGVGVPHSSPSSELPTPDCLSSHPPALCNVLVPSEATPHSEFQL